MIKINIWYDADSTVSLPELLSINIERDSFENQSDLDNYIIDYHYEQWVRRKNKYNMANFIMIFFCQYID